MFKRVMVFAVASLILAQPMWALISGRDTGPTVKMSNSKICHEKGSSYYATVKDFKPFDTLEECLKQGRLPKDKSENPVNAVVAAPTPRAKYDREAFGGWGDDDKNCLNTRHEILKAQSVGTVQMKSSCAVEKGRWNDPYTGKTFYNAKDLDIDHIVPLAYAWEHGADGWNTKKRQAFANDPVNLLAVDKSANRNKGMKGPTEWLPPDSSYRCQYLLRFERIVVIYQLRQSAGERKKLDKLRNQYCA